MKKSFKVLYFNCKNDISRNLDYIFNKSKTYNEKRGSFAWGLWHDPDLNKSGCTKNKEKAIEGYSRFMELVGENYGETNWYNINNIPSFNNLIYTVRHKKYVKVYDAAKQRLDALKNS